MTHTVTNVCDYISGHPFQRMLIENFEPTDTSHTVSCETPAYAATEYRSRGRLPFGSRRTNYVNLFQDDHLTICEESSEVNGQTVYGKPFCRAVGRPLRAPAKVFFPTVCNWDVLGVRLTLTQKAQKAVVPAGECASVVNKYYLLVGGAGIVPTEQVPVNGVNFCGDPPNVQYQQIWWWIVAFDTPSIGVCVSDTDASTLQQILDATSEWHDTSYHRAGIQLLGTSCSRDTTVGASQIPAIAYDYNLYILDGPIACVSGGSTSPEEECFETSATKQELGSDPTLAFWIARTELINLGYQNLATGWWNDIVDGFYGEAVPGVPWEVVFPPGGLNQIASCPDEDFTG